MNITWEDRKNGGFINDHRITEKPVFSFEYAWFLVNDETAQYVESHEYGVWNKDMTPEQRQEVIEFYNGWEPPAVEQPPELTPEELLQMQREGMVVTKRQGRQQMILMGILDQVQAAIDGIEDPLQRALVQSFWDDSTQYERNHPQMIQLAQAIGLTDEQLDQAFIEAAQL